MTADAARPWWASPDPATDALDGDQDPVLASRRARCATPMDDGATGVDDAEDGPSDVDDPSESVPGDGPEGSDVAGGDPAQRPSPCGVCPVCLGLDALGERHPEVAAHLVEASRHLLAAVQDLLGPPSASSRRDDATQATADGFQRIEVEGPDVAPTDGASSEGSTP